MGNKRVAVVIAHNFEDIEVTSPVQAVESAGAEFVLIGIETVRRIGKACGIDLPRAAITYFRGGPERAPDDQRQQDPR